LSDVNLLAWEGRDGGSLSTSSLVEAGRRESGKKENRRERDILRPHPYPVLPSATSFSTSSFLELPARVGSQARRKGGRGEWVSRFFAELNGTAILGDLC